MIAEASAKVFQKQCEENALVVEISMHSKYKYNISVIPMASNILVRYRTLEYKIPRTDAEGYDAAIEFIISAIREDVIAQVADDIENWDQWPDNKTYVSFTRKGVVVSSVGFDNANLVHDVKGTMKTLRFLN